MARKNKDNSKDLQITNFRHSDAKRKNNPPAKIAAEGTVPVIPKAKYRYSPRLDPRLRFDPTGSSGGDRILELIAKAQTNEPLTDEEAQLLRDALSMHEPWLEWANKQEEHQRLFRGGGFAVDPVALHIHERVSAQAILKIAARQDVERSLFADPQQSYNEAVQFYKHDIDWTNRLILGDSLQVMSSLARREDLAGKVQMIYFDPPYGIRFASNFQPEVGQRDVKDREADLTREPEMVKAYRDTWHLGVHSYLSYLRDRLFVAKELMTDSGSIFVQISEENLHRVRTILDEVFGPENAIVTILIKKKGGQKGALLEAVNDYVVWYTKDRDRASESYTQLFVESGLSKDLTRTFRWVEMRDGSVVTLSQLAAATGIDYSRNPQRLARDYPGARLFKCENSTSGGFRRNQSLPFAFEGQQFDPGVRRGSCWKHTANTENDGELCGMERMAQAGRLYVGGRQIAFRRYADDFGQKELTNWWDGLGGASSPVYVVQTNERIVERCVLMTTRPGDLVLDPTCGSGTTAVVAERWGRRWMTIDTSRVALSIARQRLMTTPFERYQIEGEGSEKLKNGSGVDPVAGFRYKKARHVTSSAIANNSYLDPIFVKYQKDLDDALNTCNIGLRMVTTDMRVKLERKLLAKQKDKGKRAITDADQRLWHLPKDKFEHWTVPNQTDPDWPEALITSVTTYRKTWRAKMDEIHEAIDKNATPVDLINEPERVPSILRVSGPFTVEAVQPPEMSLGEPTTTDMQADPDGMFGGEPDRMQTWEVREVEPLNEMEVKNVEAYLDKMVRLLRMDGVRFPNNRQMMFSRLEAVYEAGSSSGFHAEGRWVSAGDQDDDPEGPVTVVVVIGPQYGPVTSPLIVEAMRTAFRRGYTDVVFAGFSFDAAAQSEIEEYKDTKVKPHLAHIRPDVNPEMEPLLKEQPGNQLFTVFGLPRISVSPPNEDSEFQVTMEGVDIYNPVDNSIQSTGANKVAAWFLDSDYDGQTFCITQAFFPNRSAWDKLARALKGVVDEDAFEALSGTTSLPFPPGKYKRLAVKVIDPRGNEVMAVQEVGQAAEQSKKNGSKKR